MKCLILILLMIASSTLALAANCKGIEYEQGSSRSKILYRLERTEQVTPTGKIAQARFTDPDGKTTVVAEKVIFEGDKLKSYELDQNQLGDHGKLEVMGSKLKFTYQKAGKNPETSEEDLDGTLIIGPVTSDYLKANWAKLNSGETLKVRFAVLDRKETVGFKFFKDSQKNEAGRDVSVVEMKPTSIVISALVKPLYFTLDTATGQVLSVNGRTLPKLNVDGKWKDLDVDLVFQY